MYVRVPSMVSYAVAPGSMNVLFCGTTRVVGPNTVIAGAVVPLTYSVREQSASVVPFKVVQVSNGSVDLYLILYVPKL